MWSSLKVKKNASQRLPRRIQGLNTNYKNYEWYIVLIDTVMPSCFWGKSINAVFSWFFSGLSFLTKGGGDGITPTVNKEVVS